VVLPVKLIKQYSPFVAPLPMVRPETYFALVTHPLPPMYGPSCPLIDTFRAGCASRLPAMPRHRHNPASSFTQKDVFVATFRSPPPVRRPVLSMIIQINPNYVSVKD
jgi:hypothetical protein